MPLPGMPKLILVGTVMTKTPEGCPLAFNDRILGIYDEEMYYSETYTNLPFKNLMRLKKNLEPWQQISILLSYLPALHILQTCPFTVQDNRVLLNGGLGPINQALIHLCKLHQAKRIYVPVEPEYASLVREIGAKPVGPKHSDWGPQLVDTIDIVIDSIGANGFITSKAMLVETGHMVVTGCKDMDSKKDEFFYSMNKIFVDWRLNSSSRTTIFQFMKVFQSDRELFEKDFKYLDKLIWDEVLPVINTRVTPDQFKDGGRDSDALDGYDIVEIPEVQGWA
jgi:NADPH:quinone reductase-like Zn-dependent oxidoreductase